MTTHESHTSITFHAILYFPHDDGVDESDDDCGVNNKDGFSPHPLLCTMNRMMMMTMLHTHIYFFMLF